MKLVALVLFLVGAAMAGYALVQSPRYMLQDYGITLMAAGALVFLAFRNGRNSLKSPRWGIVMVVLALLLPVVTMGGVAFDVVQAAERGEYSPWGDAIMIGLMVLPILVVPLLVWSLLHLGLFWPYGYRKKQGTPLVSAVSSPYNWWLLPISAITLALTLTFAVMGDWWMAIPGAGWLYFSLSLAADWRAMLVWRRKPPEEKSAEPVSANLGT